MKSAIAPIAETKNVLRYKVETQFGGKPIRNPSSLDRESGTKKRGGPSVDKKWNQPSNIAKKAHQLVISASQGPNTFGHRREIRLFTQSRTGRKRTLGRQTPKGRRASPEDIRFARKIAPKRESSESNRRTPASLNNYIRSGQ